MNKETSGSDLPIILVMDDDKPVREVMRKMLERIGNTVEAFATGEEAVERYRFLLNANTPADLVILDMTVPKAMGGLEAAAIILKMDPSAKVMIASGNINDPALQNFQDKGIMGLVDKPFSVERLKRIVSEILQN